MAQEIADSKLIDTWSSDGLKVKPDISKIIEGWQLGEQPPHEYMNWLQNTFGSKLNHILKNGVAGWSNTTQYLSGSSVQHNGNVWLCKTTNTNSAPTDANANWKRIITVEGLTTVLGGYVKQSANLSDLANADTARTNLGLGTAATRDVGTGAGNVMEVGAFGLGSLQASAQGAFPPSVSGIYQSSISPVKTLLVLPRTGTRSTYLEVDNGGGSFSLRGEHYDPSTQESLSGVVTFFHTGNILTATGQSTEFPMSQKAVTDALDFINRIGLIDYGYVAKPYHIVAFGGEFNRADYPKLWAYLQANPSLVKTQAQWTTENTTNGMCGYFSSGNGTTTFRVPNLDKAFLRPDSRTIASFQGDAIRNITGTFSTRSNIIENVPTGVFSGVSSGNGAINNLSGQTVTFDASLVVPTANENRPKNIAVLPLIVAK